MPLRAERTGAERGDALPEAATSAEVADGLLRRLAGQECRCRRVLGTLADALLVRRGHERLGFARVDDYARERLGVSGRELQELARVGRRLEALPELAAAFDAGELSWSHVRLLASVAVADDEGEWIARARGLTVRELAEVVRSRSRSGTAPDPDDGTIDGETRARFHLRCPRRVRRLWAETAELASRMAGAVLPMWRVGEIVAAEGLSSVEGPVPDPQPVVTERAGGDRVVGRPWEPLMDAAPDDVAKLAMEVPTGNPHRLDERLRRGVRALQAVDWQTGRLLGLVAEHRLHHELGYASLAGYVRERLGLSLRRVRALIAVDRRARMHPELADAYRTGRVSLARALLLLPVVDGDCAAWVARAEEVTVRRLADMVGWAVEASEPGNPISPPSAEGRLVMPPLGEVQMCAPDLDAVIRFAGPVTVVGLLWSAVRAFTPPGRPAWQGLERLLQSARDEWRRQPRHRDPVFERDGWRCAVPACSARSSLHDHHVIYRSRGGTNVGENRIAICATHHLRGIHGMKIKVTGQAPDDLTWTIGFRPGQPPLMRTHGERYLEGAP